MYVKLMLTGDEAALRAVFVNLQETRGRDAEGIEEQACPSGRPEEIGMYKASLDFEVKTRAET